MIYRKYKSAAWGCILIAAVLIGGILFLSHNKNKGKLTMNPISKKGQNIREPAVAGQFYPADKEELIRQVDGFLAKAATEKPAGAILGLMVPHAGYEYSGAVAAAGFKQLEGTDIETVILIGNSHRAYFENAAIYSEGYFKTPLGEVEIDADLAQKIMKEDKKVKADNSAHESEHSLEVELPFLQRVLKNFKLVPILIGSASFDDIKALAYAIGKNIKDKKILLVASSDMSHYPPYDRANYADKKTYEAILNGRVEDLEKTIAQLEREGIPNAQTFLCGKEAVETLMLAMQNSGAKDIRLLKYANSGDTADDLPAGRQGKTQVVGYSAIAFYGGQNDFELSSTEQQRLLGIARQTVESYVRTGTVPALAENSPALNQKLGVFVTLKKDGELRGCIGNFTGDAKDSLWRNVMNMAVAAAAQDPRFLPVTAAELPKLEYEVSVLSPLQKIDDWRKIKLGKHGVEVKSGSRSGVFLPQVAAETGWDLDTFLEQLCSQKANLPRTCWQDKNTEIYVFTAQIIK